MPKRTEQEKFIAVYADWLPGNAPFKLGTLWPRAAGGRETVAFEFDRVALTRPELRAYTLDPNLGLYAGEQYCPREMSNFGLYQDSSPDRWGRKLMERRLERKKRKGEVTHDTRLVESDFLLGVHDAFRIGALRFKLNDQGEFLDDNNDQAAPPFVMLRELEAASLSLENENDDSEDIDNWLKMLIAPGGSLGGARPKASVVDTDNSLWIAKFPSKNDTWDVGAWELIALTLAEACGIRVPKARAQKFSSEYHTLLVQRFDRLPNGERIHFASAMTLTNHRDGDDESTGVSYAEIAQVLIQSGVNVEADLRELWTRIVFNMHISNTDDHLRNHGFLLNPNAGWLLSPVYDINPIPNGGAGLKLNVSTASNDLDVELALEVAHYYRLTTMQARDIVNEVRVITSQWRTVAEKLNLPAKEIKSMSRAFRLADFSCI